MIYLPPANVKLRDLTKKSVFLAGTIEVDNVNSYDWQEDLANYFNELDFDVFNPRRKAWDSSWSMTFENSNFNHQVNWELDSLKEADLIIMNFFPKTISPISLLEFGKYSSSGKILVICPKTYNRRGNVEIECYRENVPMFETVDDLKNYISSRIGKEYII